MTTEMTRSPQAGPKRPVPPAPKAMPVREWLIARAARAAVRTFPIRVVFPDGTRVGRGGPDSPVLRVCRPGRLYRRMAVNAAIGFCEGYLAGDWTSTDPAGVLTPFAARLTRPANRPLATLRRHIGRHRPAEERNTLDGARTNAVTHYDLPDELFAAFLDPSMTYSAAWFTDENDDLVTAQTRKIDAILDYAGVSAGTRLLEIGSGWGALALRAAGRGADVTTVTISPSQRDTVEERIAAAGLGASCRILLNDYREITGKYDAIVSVEMAEAVGVEWWPAYFGALRRLLVPGGRVGLQVITMPHDRLIATLDLATWAQGYVFPGGQLFSVEAIERQVADSAGLRITARRSLGPHYATTLRQWRERFLASTSRLAEFGLDGDFQRLWEFYLAYAEAGFRAEYLNLWQFQLTG